MATMLTTMDITRLVQRHRFTVREYYRMAEAGLLREDDRVELLDGEIIEMSPIGARHASIVDRLNHLLAAMVAGRYHVRIQNPVRLGEHSEPQPDVAVLRPRGDGYRDGHPGPADVLLIIEVADTSLDKDRLLKAPLYARAGIPEVWIVDLAGQTVHVLRQPLGLGYRSVTSARGSDPLTALEVPDLTTTAAALLGE